MSKTFELIDRNWDAVLDQAVAADHSELRIICPFIKRTTAEQPIPPSTN